MEETAIISESTFEKHPTEKCELWRFINTICRLCSLECQSNSHNILEKNILEMLEFCSSLCPSETDKLPRRICSSCLQSLNNSYLFKRKIKATDVLLRAKLKELFSKQDTIDIASNKAEAVSLHWNTVLKSKENAEISENIQSSINTNLELINSMPINEKSTATYGRVEDENYCMQNINSNEQQVKISESNKGTLTSIVHPDALPPLIPINYGVNNKTKKSSQIPPESPPPLVPLITNDGISLEKSTEEPLKNGRPRTISENDHKEKCESSKLLFCNICKKEFKEGKKLIGHLKGHIVSKNFACKICGKKYPNRSTFQIHMRSHTGERPFKCPVCNKGFARWAGVVSHMQSHDDNRPFKCDSCDQSFKILSNLERHKVLHSGVLPFCCNYCGNTFSQSANLQLHIRTYHTKERPYLCSECGKGFVSSTRLNRHMWVHTGYKPFHCQFCSKSYSNSGDLKNHEIVAHGKGENKRSFACDVCDRRFSYLCRLTKHLKIHQRPYACDQCDKTFYSSKYLEQHVGKKHSGGHSSNSNESDNGMMPS